MVAIRILSLCLAIAGVLAAAEDAGQAAAGEIRAEHVHTGGADCRHCDTKQRNSPAAITSEEIVDDETGARHLDITVEPRIGPSERIEIKVWPVNGLEDFERRSLSFADVAEGEAVIIRQDVALLEGHQWGSVAVQARLYPPADEDGNRARHRTAVMTLVVGELPEREDPKEIDPEARISMPAKARVVGADD